MLRRLKHSLVVGQWGVVYIRGSRSAAVATDLVSRI